MDQAERPIFPVWVARSGQKPFIGFLCSCLTARCLEPIVSMNEIAVKLCVIPLEGDGKPIRVEFAEMTPIVRPGLSGEMPVSDGEQVMDRIDPGFVLF